MRYIEKEILLINWNGLSGIISFFKHSIKGNKNKMDSPIKL